jgi:hypothetical protein
MAKDYELGDRGSIPDRVMGSFFSPQRPVLGLTQRPFQWVTRALSSEAKRQGREDKHYLPYSAKAKNDEAIPPFYHTTLWHGA